MSYKFSVPSGWAESTLQEFCTTVADGTHDSPKKSEHGRFLVTSKNIVGGRLDLSKSYRISDEDFDQINRRSKVDVNDVLLSMIGTVGEACLIEKEPGFAIKNVGLLKNDDPLRARWLYFYLRSAQAQEHIRERLRGTTQQYLPLGEIRKFPIIYPISRLRMGGIVGVLGALNDKTQINQQINQTLEQMAQATFKGWFVDFEPVKAKIAARERWQAHQSAQQPASPVCYAAELEPESVDPELENRMTLAAMQAISGKTEAQLARLQTEHPEHYAELRATADLFPAAMQASELGEIPAGWRVAPFSDIARLDTTSVKPAQYPEKEWEHYSIPAFDDGQTPAYELGADIKSNKYKVHRSAVLASKLNPHFPRTWIPRVEDETAAICSTEFMPFVPLEESYRPFVAGMITSAPFQSGMMMRVTGSTGSRQRAQPKQVAVMDVVTPPTALIAAYSKLADPLMASTARNISQSQTLAKLRDTLLPKLLSGEITVPDAESNAAEASGA